MITEESATLVMSASFLRNVLSASFRRRHMFCPLAPHEASRCAICGHIGRTVCACHRPGPMKNVTNAVASNASLDAFSHRMRDELQRSPTGLHRLVSGTSFVLEKTTIPRPPEHAEYNEGRAHAMSQMRDLSVCILWDEGTNLARSPLPLLCHIPAGFGVS